MTREQEAMEILKAWEKETKLVNTIRTRRTGGSMWVFDINGISDNVPFVSFVHSGHRHRMDDSFYLRIELGAAL